MNHNPSLLLNLSFHLVESHRFQYNIIEQVVANNRNENDDNSGGGGFERAVIFNGVNMFDIDFIIVCIEGVKREKHI